MCERERQRESVCVCVFIAVFLSVLYKCLMINIVTLEYD